MAAFDRENRLEWRIIGESDKKIGENRQKCRIFGPQRTPARAGPQLSPTRLFAPFFAAMLQVHCNHRDQFSCFVVTARVFHPLLRLRSFSFDLLLA
jgi:hypothetical protein